MVEEICYSKKCLSNANSECLNRRNKHRVCCVDDINDEVELLIPTIDQIYDAVQYSTISKDTFSKAMYVSDILNSQSECDIKIVQEIKRASYFFYNSLKLYS